MEDKAIVDLYWARSEKAIAETRKKYGGYCYTIAKNILENREDSEECVNDTYLRAWHSMPESRPSLLGAFLGKITRNLALDRVFARQVKKRGGGQVPAALEELSECVPGRDTVEKRIEEEELRDTIEAFLKELPAEQRVIFIRRYWYMDPVKEIAKRFRFSESKTKMILLRTRGKLKERLKSEGVYLE